MEIKLNKFLLYSVVYTFYTYVFIFSNAFHCLLFYISDNYLLFLHIKITKYSEVNEVQILVQIVVISSYYVSH